VVTFSAELDLGMASLAEIVDPMAQRSLEDSLATILRSVLVHPRVSNTDVIRCGHATTPVEVAQG
jgi:hypothetical protein